MKEINKERKSHSSISTTSMNYFKYSNKKRRSKYESDSNDDYEEDNKESDNEEDDNTIDISSSKKFTNRQILNTLMRQKTINALEKFVIDHEVSNNYDSNESEDENTVKKKKKSRLDLKMSKDNHPYLFGFNYFLSTINFDIMSYMNRNIELKIKLAYVIVTNKKIKKFFKNHTADDLINLLLNVTKTIDKSDKKQVKKNKEIYNELTIKCSAIAKSFFTDDALKVIYIFTEGFRDDAVSFGKILLDSITTDHINVLFNAFKIYKYIFKAKNIRTLTKYIGAKTTKSKDKVFDELNDSTKIFIDEIIPDFIGYASKYSSTAGQIYLNSINEFLLFSI